MTIGRRFSISTWRKSNAASSAETNTAASIISRDVERFARG